MADSMRNENMQDEILKYSFSQLDIARYIDNFIESRRYETEKVLIQETFLDFRDKYPTWREVVDAIAALPLKSYVKGSSDNSLETYALLLDMFETLQHGHSLNQHQSSILEKLQKKTQEKSRKKLLEGQGKFPLGRRGAAG